VFLQACSLGHADCVRALVKAGANTALLNRSGRTGWQLAATAAGASRPEGGGWADTVTVLEKYAARGRGKEYERLRWESELHAANAAVAALETSELALGNVAQPALR
jgi:hypothetical protein